MKEPKVKFSPLAKRAMETMDVKSPRQPDFTVTEVKLGQCWSDANSQGFLIEWGTKSAGFGTLTVYLDKKTGKLTADMEAMGKRFSKEVLAKLICEALIDAIEVKIT